MAIETDGPKQVLQEVEKRLAALEIFLAAVCRAGDSALNTWLAQALPGGKRLRPRLLFLCASFGPHDDREAQRAAAGIELVHLASLVHDDILDAAALRRNRPALHRLAGPHAAVLTGDYLFATAFQLLARVRPQVLAEVTAAIRLMCEGEIAEKQRAGRGLRFYYACISKKTASLFASASAGGGHLCGLPAYLIDYLALYGLSLGTAFQLIDDLLDLTADSRRLGKPTRHDLVQGTLTLPVLVFLEHSPRAAGWRSRLERGGLTGEEAAALVTVLAEEGYLAAAREAALAELELARLALAALPARPAREALASLAAQLPALLEVGRIP